MLRSRTSPIGTHNRNEHPCVMSVDGPTRREFLASAASAPALCALVAAPALAQAAPRVVVIGGGFAGATAARALKKADPRIAVTLVTGDRTFTACPFSNLVIGGLRNLNQQQFGYDNVAGDGIELTADCQIVLGRTPDEQALVRGSSARR